MSAVRIETYRDDLSAREAIREIFFLSSSREFTDRAQKDAFFARWTDYYFTHEPQHIYVARDGGGELLGYLMGAEDSHAALAFYQDRIASYSLFADQFPAYPAHLHINCHPRARGQGVGSKLISHFVSVLRGTGVHIVTSPSSPNVAFYRKNGFVFELTREWRGAPLRFMGRSLDPA